MQGDPRPVCWGLVPLLLLGACGHGLFTPSYQLELPPVPSAWAEILGTPHWRVAWFGPEGTWETLDTAASEVSNIQVIEEWTNPIIAFPYWPERGILPELMRPAGALFPFDVNDRQIRLSWRGGVDAVVYLALAAHAPEGQGNKTPRLPHYFNWPRFRELLEDPGIPEAIRHDPWTADWHSIALKIVQSGFDRRRIIPLEQEELSVPVPQGDRWIGTSPFMEALNREAGDSLHLQVSSQVDTYIASAGMVRCTQGIWIWIPFKSEE